MSQHFLKTNPAAAIKKKKKQTCNIVTEGHIDTR